MSSEVTVKIQSLLWWISSIAVSVLCCSMLFVVFASYMVDIKASEQNNSARIESIEAREDKILFELDSLQKHLAPAVAQPAAATPGVTPPAPASDATAPVVTPPSVATPTVSVPSIPETTAPVAPAPTSPTPLTPSTPEKK